MRKVAGLRKIITMSCDLPNYKMADGRLFTDYRPRCEVQSAVPQHISGGTGHRQFLIEHGSQLMARDRAAALAAVGGPCKPCDIPTTMLPEADVFVCNTTTCRREKRAPYPALGTGRE